MGAGASTATKALRGGGGANLEKIARAVEGFDLTSLDNAGRATMRDELRSPGVLDQPNLARYAAGLDVAALDDAERATVCDALGKIELPDENDDADDDDAATESANASEADTRSLRLDNRSFFADLHPKFKVNSVDGGEVTSDYEKNFEILQGGKAIGTIVRPLGSGAYGTVYLFELGDHQAGQESTEERYCAAKAAKANLDAQGRARVEKAMAVECSIGFAMARSAHAASVVRMIVPDLPDLSTNARGALLLCDYCDSGDLKVAMGEDYKGELYTRTTDDGVRLWPLASVTLQIYLGLRHMHEHGILHQDFKPENLMLHSDGVCKIIDFGLAGFSRWSDEDPWLASAGKQRVLCARVEGGTPLYFSPEQEGLFEQLKDESLTELARAAIKARASSRITPATSDLFQAALTVLEMYCRPANFTALRCTAARRDRALKIPLKTLAADRAGRAHRKPAHEIKGMKSDQVEAWLFDDCNVGFASKWRGHIASKCEDGAHVLKCGRSTQTAKAAPLELPYGYAIQLATALHRNVRDEVDEMDARVGALLANSLARDVGARPRTSNAALDALGAQTELSDATKALRTAVGFEQLPRAVRADVGATRSHADSDVESTLGGIARALVIHGDARGALDACSQWLGVAGSDAARCRALDAYCNLWKHQGAEFEELELSRCTPHGHWRSEMLAGEGVLAKLFEAARASRSLTSLDLSRQQLTSAASADGGGGALDALLAEDWSVSLRVLKLSGCSLRGAVPAKLGKISSLRVMDLSDNALGGELPAAALGRLTELTELALQRNALEGPPLAALLDALGPLARALRALSLSENRGLGEGQPIPGPKLAAFGELQVLELAAMRLEGTMPPELGSHSKLRILDLSDNLLTGAMPQSVSDLACEIFTKGNPSFGQRHKLKIQESLGNDPGNFRCGSAQSVSWTGDEPVSGDPVRPCTEAFERLAKQLADGDGAAVVSCLFVASNSTDPAHAAQQLKELRALAPDDCTIHAVSSLRGGLGERGTSAVGLFGLARGSGESSLGVATGASTSPTAARAAAERACAQATERAAVGKPPSVVFVTATPGAEEAVLAGIASALGSEVPVIGGSAASGAGELKVDHFWVGASAPGVDAVVSGDAVVVTLLWPTVPVECVFSSCYSPTALRGVVAAVEGRECVTIQERDGSGRLSEPRPAVDVYMQWAGQELARGLGAPAADEWAALSLDAKRERLEAGNMLALSTTRPLAKVEDVSEDVDDVATAETRAPTKRTPFYTLMHPSGVTKRGGIELFATPAVGDELVCMRGTTADLCEEFTGVAGHGGGTRGALAIYCGGCALHVKEDLAKVGARLSELIHGQPLLGVCTYGEQGVAPNGVSHHGNLMYSMLLFGGGD